MYYILMSMAQGYSSESTILEPKSLHLQIILQNYFVKTPHYIEGHIDIYSALYGTRPKIQSTKWLSSALQ